MPVSSRTRKKEKDAITLSLYASVAIMCLLTILLFWTTWSHNIFSAYGLAPHGYCFLWNTHLVTLHVVSDTLIGLAYVAISATLLYFVRSLQRNLPFRWIFVAFGAFIVACGTTHFLEVWTLWYATYWLSGTVKLITAVASLSTAIILPPLLPKARSLVASARASEERKQQLESAHAELEKLYERAQANLLVMQQTREILQHELTSQSQDIIALTNEAIIQKHKLEMANQQLREMARLQQNFVSVVSHEFRTTLTGIQGFSELLYSEDFSSDEVKEYASDIHTDATRLNRMITNLLDLERMKVGKMSLHPESLDLNDLLTKLVEKTRLTTPPNYPIYLRLDHTLPPIDADRDKLTQVILNLLSNAVKYSPDGGAIVVSSSLEEGTAHLSVQDHGRGLSPEDIARLFIPYNRVRSEETRHIQGSGLGLAIIREICELHHGRVWVESKIGQGSTFHITLPLKVRSEVSLKVGNDT